MTIETLPDFPAIEQINRALWHVGKTRGAAVLVGAGFSRNAERIHDAVPQPPDWSTLTKRLQVRLGYDESEYKDPLRLPQEFIASLGRSALDRMLLEQIPDDQWLPGELHKLLVSLKWVDILTTNWDTLLERAATLNLAQNYDVVRCLDDLSTTRAPRVVKLHGSLPSNRPFIIAEEDYRTYPVKFAPFVNLVQQVLLENELCLLGFSGDDPNFLEWSGWIRDHLGVSARRIYLVGAFNLRPAQRRLFEQRNITPIDLYPLVADMEASQRHEIATEMFLTYLRDHRPLPTWRWKSGDAGAFPQMHPALSDEQLASRFVDVPAEWASVRKAYPGWVACPPELRYQLTEHTFHWLWRPRVIETAEPTIRGRFIYEAVWRLETSFTPIFDHKTIILAVVNDSTCWDDLRQRDFVLAALLRMAREIRDEELFNQMCEILEARQIHNSEAASILAYERALWALDGLDYVSLEHLGPLVDGADPVWKLRRAALYAELGDVELARESARTSLAEARDHYLRDRDSIWALSRLAWSRNIARQYRDWMEAFKPDVHEVEFSSLDQKIHETMCDPWDWLRDLDEIIDKALKTLQEDTPAIEPRFEPGTYRQRGNNLRLGSWLGQPLFDCFRLSAVIGLPARTAHATFLADRMQRADAFGDVADDADLLRVLRIAQSDEDKTVDRHFGRLSIARLTMAQVHFLLDALNAALAYGLEQLKTRKGWQDQFWSRRCAQYLEVISRLVIRLDSDQATQFFQRACAFAQDERWRSLEMFDALESLLERSLSAVRPEERAALLVPLLNFPIPDEIHIPIHVQNQWPEISSSLTDSLLLDPAVLEAFNKRVTELIHIVKDGSLVSRSQAANRLIRLSISSLLTDEQAQQFSDALWSRRSPETGFPADTNLYPHVFLRLPGPGDATPTALLKNEACIAGINNFLVTLSNVSRKTPGSPLAPLRIFDKDEALQFLERCLSWAPTHIPKHDFNQTERSNREANQAIGAIIADQILPLFERGELTDDLKDRIVVQSHNTTGMIRAFPELVRLFPDSSDTLVSNILDAMLSTDESECWCSFNALYRWLRGWQADRFEPVGPRLIEAMLWIIDTRSDSGRAHALLNALHCVRAGALRDNDCERLDHALSLIFRETSYDTVRYTTNLTHIRASCVRLANALKGMHIQTPGAESWLKLVNADPLPEVRFALSQDIE